MFLIEERGRGESHQHEQGAQHQCTDKASSPEHRGLALCAHRYAWLTQLTPRKPCHGMTIVRGRGG